MKIWKKKGDGFWTFSHCISWINTDKKFFFFFIVHLSNWTCLDSEKQEGWNLFTFEVKAKMKLRSPPYYPIEKQVFFYFLKFHSFSFYFSPLTWWKHIRWTLKTKPRIDRKKRWRVKRAIERWPRKSKGGPRATGTMRSIWWREWQIRDEGRARAVCSRTCSNSTYSTTHRIDRAISWSPSRPVEPFCRWWAPPAQHETAWWPTTGPSLAWPTSRPIGSRSLLKLPISCQDKTWSSNWARPSSRRAHPLTGS